MVRRWVASYREHGEQGLRKKHSHYDARFKLSVLQRMWRDELSYAQVAALFGIRNERSIPIWERLYHEGGIDALTPRRRGRPPKMTTSPPQKPTEDAVQDERTREDNAAMESFFGTLKSECYRLTRFVNVEQLRDALSRYIHYYNHERIKLKLNGLSPVQYRTQSSAA